MNRLWLPHIILNSSFIYEPEEHSLWTDMGWQMTVVNSFHVSCILLLWMRIENCSGYALLWLVLVVITSGITVNGLILAVIPWRLYSRILTYYLLWLRSLHLGMHLALDQVKKCTVPLVWNVSRDNYSSVFRYLLPLLTLLVWTLHQVIPNFPQKHWCVQLELYEIGNFHSGKYSCCVQDYDVM